MAFLTHRHICLVASMALVSTWSMAASGADETYKNLTLEERLYQYDGYGAEWSADVGSDGLWFVPKDLVDDTNSTYSAPLKVRNVAASNTLVIGGNDTGTEGYVGVGTDTPAYPLDVLYTRDNPTGDGLMKVLVLTGTNTNLDKGSDAGFALTNGRTGKAWNFRTTDDGDGFAATINGTGGTEFRIVNASTRYTGANLYLGSGAKCENGVWSNRSSRSSKENIQPLETQAALQAFHQLQPMTYNYKTDKTENYVGFIAEDVPELVATKTRDSLSAMDMVAVLTKVVQVQEEKIAALEAQQTEMTALKERLVMMETILTNLALHDDKATSKNPTAKLGF
jgi:uncharacterized protein (DUF1499 family)